MPTTDELSRRRRLVYHGLRDHVPGPTVSLAVRLCDEEFRAEPAFSVLKFLDRLAAADPAAAAAKPRLFAHLQRLRLQPADALGPDPRGPATDATPPAPAPRTPPAAGPAAGDGWDAIFNTLLTELTVALWKVHAGLPPRVARHLTSAAHGPGLAGVAARELADWVRTGKPAFTAGTTRDDMHAVLHTWYLWACDELGPVETDRLFARAMRATEQHPAATRCPPQALL